MNKTSRKKVRNWERKNPTVKKDWNFSCEKSHKSSLSAIFLTISQSHRKNLYIFPAFFLVLWKMLENSFVMKLTNQISPNPSAVGPPPAALGIHRLIANHGFTITLRTVLFQKWGNKKRSLKPFPWFLTRNFVIEKTYTKTQLTINSFQWYDVFKEFFFYFYLSTQGIYPWKHTPKTGRRPPE